MFSGSRKMDNVDTLKILVEKIASGETLQS